MPFFLLPSLFVGLLYLWSPSLVPSPVETPSLEQARKWLDRERWDKAIEAYQAIVDEDPGNGMAWYLLAFCQSQSGDLAASMRSNLASLEHGGPRAGTLYNMACGYEGGGELQKAEDALLKSIEEGYLDFDWIAKDTDLVRTRARGKVPFPTPHEFRELKGRNGVVMPYELILPQGYDPERNYPAMVLLGPGSGPLSASWTYQQLCDGDTGQQQSIVLLLVTPDRGWYTHPTHHALEDLLKAIRKQHAIDGERFHLVGFGEGTDAASTYAGMSKRYFQSFTIIGGRPFEGDEEDRMTRHLDLPLTFILGDRDPAGMAEAERVVELTSVKGGRAQLRRLPQEGGNLKSLHHGKWLAMTREALGLTN